MVKIGVTGTFCAGKDTLAEYLIGKGFEHISLSDHIIRDELVARNMPIIRENFRIIANELRKELGAGVLAKRALERMMAGKNYVITSVRNPVEAKTLQQSGDFILVSVDAPIEIRFQRMLSRETIKTSDKDKDKANLVFEQFAEAERKELVSDDPTKQRLVDCMKMADVTMINDSSAELFRKKIEEILSRAISEKNVQTF